MIIIGKPYIKEMEDGTVRLCSNVSYDGENNEIWYSLGYDNIVNVIGD